MSDNSIQIFNFQSVSLRAEIFDVTPWFVARDVMNVLGYALTSTPAATFSAVPEEWKEVKRIHTPGGMQDVMMVSEQGLYFFLARSNKPKALPFQKWLAGDVVPSIRKYGGYGVMIEQIRRHMENVEQVPRGYFSIISLTFEMVINPLERAGGRLKEGACPDGSIGRMFKKWLVDNGIDDSAAIHYRHRYPDREPPNNEFEALAWPDSYAGYAREFITKVWLNKQIIPYLKRSKQEWLIPIAEKQFEAIPLDKRKALS